MKERTYFEVFVITEPFEPEHLSDLLWICSPLAISENESSLSLFYDTDQGVDIVQSAMENFHQQGLFNSYTVFGEICEMRNWNEEWEKNLSVIRISDRLVVRPSCKEYIPNDNEIVLTIDPKMSFGTGEHQTTKLMLLLLEKYISAEQTVLDIGTGTGVLAIAAVKLGAQSAMAIDNDDWCYENGVENIKINEVEEKVTIRTAAIDQIEPMEYDVITANIQKNVLLEISRDIRMHLKEGGLLLLSGLLSGDESDIRRQYEQFGLIYIETLAMDEWIAIVFALQHER
jgi:ribosomal protein L11 methyltransferase